MIDGHIGISPEGLIDIYDVADRMGVSIRTAWRIIQKYSDFPQKIKLGRRCSRWDEKEVDEWIEKRIENAKSAYA